MKLKLELMMAELSIKRFSLTFQSRASECVDLEPLTSICTSSEDYDGSNEEREIGVDPSFK